MTSEAAPEPLVPVTQEDMVFDRSSRLWGQAGQKRLREGHVIVLGVTSVVSEVLKNMILPGLGRWTIVDPNDVTLNDLGTNFFFEQSDLGKSRGEALVRSLTDLHPEFTRGSAVRPASFDEVLNPSYFVQEGATLVLASGMLTEEQLVRLGDGLVGRGIPIVHVKVTGMFGLVHVQSDPRFVTDAVPDADSKIIDLRILNPFPALAQLYDELDPMTVDDTVFNHLPFTCVIYHALKRWRAANPDSGARGFPASPLSSVWQKEIRPIITSFQRKKKVDSDGEEKWIPWLPDSFQEAINKFAPSLNLTKRNLPELTALLNDPRVVDPVAEVARLGSARAVDVFYFIVHGIRKFRENHFNEMPVCLSLPDIETSTHVYQKMMAVFKAKAHEDSDEVFSYVTEALRLAGRDPRSVDPNHVHHVCQHVWELTAYYYPTFRSFYHESFDERYKGDAASLKWLLAARAASHLRNKDAAHQEPGKAASLESLGASTEATLQAIRAEIKSFTKPEVYAALFPTEGEYDQVAEYVRYGGTEPIFIAAIVGGVASQECIKIVQQMRLPADGPLLFDGITSVFSTVKIQH